MAGSESKETQLDASDLTVGEVESLEKVTGKTFGAISRDFQNQDFSVKTLKALAWVIQRRTNPDLTLNDVNDVKLSSLFSKNGDTPNPPA